MPTFHRNSANPAGYDPVPSGYDFINAPASNLPPGAGVPAVFDGIKAGGPNDGTYFFAFGEDLTSLYINRGMNALADNADTLDNYLRRPLALPTRTADVTPGGPISTITLPGPPVPVTTPAVYLGTTGQDSIPEGLLTLFDILDSNDEEIVDPATGTRTVVASITSTNGGDAIGSGFALGTITLHLNQAIPSGQTYRVYYGEKANLSDMAPDAFTVIKVRGALEVPAAVEDIFLQITNPGTVPELVTALVATAFETPSNGRLSPSYEQYFNVDPTATSGSAFWAWAWTSRTRTGSARAPMELIDDPTVATVRTPPGLTGELILDTGMGYGCLGTFTMFDNNMETAAPANMRGFLPLSSSTLAQGDQYPRLFEQEQNSGSPGTKPNSLLQSLNARFTVTVGDGTNSFGDFTGAGAIETALTYIHTYNIQNATILVKPGSYTWSSAHVMSMNFLLIKGMGSAAVTITKSGTNQMIEMTSGGHLEVEGLTAQVTAGSNFLGILTDAFSSLFMKDCVWVSMYHTMVGPTAYTPSSLGTIGRASCFIADNCQFIGLLGNSGAAGTGSIAVDFQIQGGATYHPVGFYFEKCYFDCAAEAKPVRIQAITGLSTGVQVQGVIFNKCEYSLGGSSATGTNYNNNTGVIEVDPNGAGVHLTIQDMTWQDCNVYQFNSFSSVLTLARIYGVSRTGAGGVVGIGTVNIIRGNWSAANAQTEAVTYSPLVIVAAHINVQDVTFYGNASGSGDVTSVDQDLDLTGNVPTTTGTHQWAQFVFAAGFSTSFQEDSDTSLTMKNVTFKGLANYTTNGDVWLFGGMTTNVEGVRLTQFSNGTGAGGNPLPNARFRYTPYGMFGSVKNVSVDGTLSGGAFSNSLTTKVTNSGMILLDAHQLNPSFDSTPRVYENLCVSGFEYTSGGDADDGITLSAGCLSFSTHNHCTHLRNCRAMASSEFGTYFRYGVKASTGGGFTNNLVDVRISGGAYGNSWYDCIGIFPASFSRFELSLAKIVNAGQSGSGGGYALNMAPSVWQTLGVPYLNTIHIVDNRCSGSSGLDASSTHEVEMRFSTSNADDTVTGVCRGNVCSNAAGSTWTGIRVSQGVHGSLDSPENYVGVQTLLGIDTGIDAIGTPTEFYFVNGDEMNQNIATLYTP